MRSGGGKLPGGGLGVLVLIVLVVLGAIFGRPGSQEDTPVQPIPQVGQATATQASQAAQAQPTPTRAPSGTTPRPAASGGGDTWTVMLYQDADDKVLEHDIYVDLNEAERVGSTENVNIVAQVDRYQGGFNGDGDWVGTKRFYVTQDDDLNRVGSQEIEDLGEANMADRETLVDFVTWAIENYPADKYMLVMADHGMGWPGGWSDPTSRRAEGSSAPLAGKLHDMLYLNEIADALQEIHDNTGLDKFELVGFDACLMAHLEVFAALEPHARYSVASQETEPALGWAYTSFLSELVANPSMSGADLSQVILDTYISGDQRIVDDQARAEFAGRGQPTGGLFGMLLGDVAGGPTAQQVASQLEQNITLSAVDLSAIPQLMKSVNNFANEMQTVDQKAVAKIRTYTQSFTSIFGSDVPPSYIDLGHFGALFQKAGASGALGDVVNEMLAALDQAVIDETHGPKVPGSTGISIYFPVSQLYRTPEAGPQSYTQLANYFVEDSLWDDFLSFHYTGREFAPETNRAASAEEAVNVRGPGAGGITVSPITLSANTAAPGRPIQMSTHIEGQNVGYVYFFTGFYDSAANSIFTADMDYLESEETEELNGVYYPVWPEDGTFDMEFEWEPLFFVINDGANTATALFQPETYGATPEEAIYSVTGRYTFGDDGETREARLYFSDGILRQVFGFNGEENVGAPAEIIPRAGDSFTIYEKWSDLDAEGNVVGVVYEDGETLTFSDQPFTWEQQDAAVGEYVIGFIVEDLDGNRTQVFAPVTVE
jgi:hypothetical protein